MRSRIGALIAAGVLLAGCQLSTMSRYDATTDKGVTALQRGIGRLFTKLETLAAESPALESLTESCRPAKFEASYRELQNHLRALLVHNEAREKNELTVRQRTGLRASLTPPQKLHKARCESASPEPRIAEPAGRAPAPPARKRSSYWGASRRKSRWSSPTPRASCRISKPQERPRFSATR